MARTKNYVNETKLAHLKMCVEQKFGRPIVSSKDANDLANFLTSANIGNINAQTLRRLFGLVPTNFSPSVYTLDTLSFYVANCSWAQYNPSNKINNTTKIIANLFLNFYADPNFIESNVVDAIAQNEELQNILLDKIAPLKHARIDFFGVRPLRDFLNKVYKRSLLTYTKSKPTNEAFIFSYGLLFLGAFLTENFEETKRYFLLMEQTPLSDEVFNTPAGRKFGVPLIYYHMTGNENQFKKVFNDCLNTREKYKQLMDYHNSNFDSIVIEYLLLINRLDEAKLILKLHIKEKKKKKVKDHFPYYPQLFNLICGCATGDKTLLTYFDINQLRLGERKYYNLIFICYQLKMINRTTVLKRKKLLKQLGQLVKDTGYTWFYKLVEEKNL